MGILILKYFSSRPYVFLTYILVIGSLFLFYVDVNWTIPSLQTIPTAAIDSTTSAIISTLFTWTQEAVAPVSGIISSALFFAGSVGSFLNPTRLTYLIESITPMWLIYLSIAKAVFCFAICIIVDLLIRIV